MDECLHIHNVHMCLWNLVGFPYTTLSHYTITITARYYHCRTVAVWSITKITLPVVKRVETQADIELCGNFDVVKNYCWYSQVRNKCRVLILAFFVTTHRTNPRSLFRLIHSFFFCWSVLALIYVAPQTYQEISSQCKSFGMAHSFSRPIFLAFSPLSWFLFFFLFPTPFPLLHLFS